MKSVIFKRLFQIGFLPCLLLMFARLYANISFSTPLHIVTSGFEEESLYAIWKWINNLAVYTKPHDFPYAASYFNWLFYGFYGALIQGILILLSCSDEWIPTIGRLITFTGVSYGVLIAYRLFKSVGTDAWLAFILSGFLFWGPLMGFWAITVRPDPIAVVFDTLAIYCFLSFELKNNRCFLSILLCALFCYISWAFKEINIVTPIAISLYLLSMRAWRCLVLFSFILGGLVLFTFFWGSDAYVNMMWMKDTETGLSRFVWNQNLIKFLTKSLPILFMLGILSVNTSFYWRNLQPATRLAITGLLGWGLVLLPASAKVGASDNYHFIALLYMTIGLASLWSTRSPLWQERALMGGVVGFLLTAIGVGFNAKVSLMDLHQYHMSIKQCIESLPKPLFITNHYTALPWMNTTRPNFVLAHNYGFDWVKGYPFQYGGVEGLIANGYFASLLIHPESITFDSMIKNLHTTLYQKQPEVCEGFTVFLKK